MVKLCQLVLSCTTYVPPSYRNQRHGAHLCQHPKKPTPVLPSGEQRKVACLRHFPHLLHRRLSAYLLDAVERERGQLLQGNDGYVFQTQPRASSTAQHISTIILYIFIYIYISSIVHAGLSASCFCNMCFQYLHSGACSMYTV